MTDQKTYREVAPDDLSAKRVKKGRGRKWPFMEMEVGASIAVEEIGMHRAARSAATYARQVSGRRFKTVKMGNGVLLIKRVE